MKRKKFHEQTKGKMKGIEGELPDFAKKNEEEHLKNQLRKSKIIQHIQNLKIENQKLKKKVLKIINDLKNEENMSKIEYLSNSLNPLKSFLEDLKKFSENLKTDDAELLYIGFSCLGIFLTDMEKEQISNLYYEKQENNLFFNILVEFEKFQKKEKLISYENQEKLWIFFGFFLFKINDKNKANEFLESIIDITTKNKNWKKIDIDTKKILIKKYMENYKEIINLDRLFNIFLNVIGEKRELLEILEKQEKKDMIDKFFEIEKEHSEIFAQTYLEMFFK